MFEVGFTEIILIRVWRCSCLGRKSCQSLRPRSAAGRGEPSPWRASCGRSWTRK